MAQLERLKKRIFGVRSNQDRDSVDRLVDELWLLSSGAHWREHCRCGRELSCLGYNQLVLQQLQSTAVLA